MAPFIFDLLGVGIGDPPRTGKRTICNVIVGAIGERLNGEHVLITIFRFAELTKGFVLINQWLRLVDGSRFIITHIEPVKAVFLAPLTIG